MNRLVLSLGLVAALSGCTPGGQEKTHVRLGAIHAEQRTGAHLGNESSSFRSQSFSA